MLSGDRNVIASIRAWSKFLTGSFIMPFHLQDFTNSNKKKHLFLLIFNNYLFSVYLSFL